MDLEECIVCTEPLWKDNGLILDENATVQLVCGHLIHGDCWTDFGKTKPIVYETNPSLQTGPCPICLQGTTIATILPSKFETEAYWKHRVLNSIDTLGPSAYGVILWISLRDTILSSISDNDRSQIIMLCEDINTTDQLKSKIDEEIFANKSSLNQQRNADGKYIGDVYREVYQVREFGNDLETHDSWKNITQDTFIFKWEWKSALHLCQMNGCSNTATSTCSKCHVTQYCGKECQRQHWKGYHKEKCSLPAQ